MEKFYEEKERKMVEVYTADGEKVFASDIDIAEKWLAMNRGTYPDAYIVDVDNVDEESTETVAQE